MKLFRAAIFVIIGSLMVSRRVFALCTISASLARDLIICEEDAHMPAAPFSVPNVWIIPAAYSAPHSVDGFLRCPNRNSSLCRDKPIECQPRLVPL